MDALVNWIQNNQELITAMALNLISGLVIFVVGRWGAKLAVGLLSRVMKSRNVEPAVSSFIANLVYTSLLVLVVITALGRVGVETTTFAAVIAAAGLAIGLSLQGSLSNFASGVLLVIFRPFKAGDFVEAGGVSGSISQIQIFSTELLTPDNKVIVVPNSQIMSGPIVNYSRKPTRRLDLLIGISYDSDIKKAKQVIETVVNGHDKVLKDPAWTIAVASLGDSSVNLTVRVWVNTGDYWPTHFALLETIKISLDQQGIVIPFPQMDVHLHKQA